MLLLDPLFSFLEYTSRRKLSLISGEFLISKFSFKQLVRQEAIESAFFVKAERRFIFKRLATCLICIFSVKRALRMYNYKMFLHRQFNFSQFCTKLIRSPYPVFERGSMKTCFGLFWRWQILEMTSKMHHPECVSWPCCG